MSLTVEDFVEFAGEITLDSGKRFPVEPWQALVVEDFLSGIPELHLWVPEANGKTTLAAAICLWHLITHPNPKVIVAAASKLQARTLYFQAVGMIVSTPALEERLLIRDGSLEFLLPGRERDVGLKVIAADEKRAHGEIMSLMVFDEMHAHPGLGLYRTLAGKAQKREGCQVLSITTGGEPDSEFEVMRSTILAASPDVTRPGPRCTRAAGPQHIAWNYALSPDDDVEDMAVVKLANPFTGITEATLRAKRDLPGFEPKHWRTFVCNLPTRDFESRFLPEQEWRAAEIADAIPEGEPVTVGVDWGWIEDATALVAVWEDGEQLIVGEAVVVDPPRNGTQLDPERVWLALAAIQERNPITMVVHDASAMGGGHLMSGWLEERLEATIVAVQPKDMAEASGTFLEWLRNGALKHAQCPVLTRHLLNAIRYPVGATGDLFRLARPKESRHAPSQRSIREIDAAVAAVLGVWGVVAGIGAPEPWIQVI